MYTWNTDPVSASKAHRYSSGTPASRRYAALLVSTAALWISLACAAAAPALEHLTPPTASPKAGPPWAVAQIPKPSTGATPQFAAEPASPTATLTPPTASAESAQPQLESSATESAAPQPEASATGEIAPTEAEGSGQITMEIVDQDTQAAPSQEAPAEGSASGKYILVSLSEQHLYAYENGQLVYSFVASTGMGNSTRIGTFHVLDKIPNAYGANWNIWMPNWMGIYWSGSLENGIHALPILPGGGRLWAGYLGTPISYGCVVLGVDESLELYNWADVGTPVEIRW